MGDWKTDKTETLEVGLQSYKIHLWTIKDKQESGNKAKDNKEK